MVIKEGGPNICLVIKEGGLNIGLVIGLFGIVKEGRQVKSLISTVMYIQYRIVYAVSIFN